MRGIYCYNCKHRREERRCKCGEFRVYIQFQINKHLYQIWHDTNGNYLHYADAEKLKEDINRERRAGTFNIARYTQSEERKFGKAFEKFIEYKKSKVHPSTIYLYTSYQRNHFRPLIEIKDAKYN